MKILSRHEVREIIRRCLSYKLTLTEIKQTVRAKEKQAMEERNGRYGWN
jgi:hypothetical protein